ncbi:MAG: prolyl hydroxylase family protein [Burkholderiaceae bacterium]
MAQSKRRKPKKQSPASDIAPVQAAASRASVSQPSVAPVRSLPAQWQDWIAENLTRGCAEADMTKVMVENGFDATYATHAISVIRDMARRVQAANIDVGSLSTYRCEPIRLPPVASIQAQDQSVGIGFVMTDPNVALLEGLLSPSDCEELIEQSRGKLKRSEVVNRKTGGFEVDAVRTSEGTHFERGETETIRRIEQRIAEVTGVPVENGEPLQILHYEIGGEYLAHHDYFEPNDPGSAVHLATGGQRIATIVIYLNTVPAGGETGFPNLDLSVRARAGNAVYFEYSNSDNELDERCLHAGVPVEKGEKWIATKWLRQSAYTRP